MNSEIKKLTLNYLNVIDEQIIFFDSDCRVIHFNEAAMKRFKDNISLLIGKDGTELCEFRDYIDIKACPVIKAKKTGRKQFAEIKTKDGSFYQVIVYPIVEKKKISGFVEISTDISERKKIEEDLIKKKNQFVKLVEDSEIDWIWETDKNNFFTYSSSKAKDLLGYDSEELLGKTPGDFMTPLEAVRVRSFFSQIKDKRQPLLFFEFEVIHKNGQIKVFETNAIPIINFKGELMGYRGINRDITERKKTEEELIRNEEKFRSIVETTSDWIWEVDEEGIYTYCNPKVKDLLGFEPEEIVGEHVTQFRSFEEQEKMFKVFMDFVERKESFAQIETIYTHKNGQMRTMETSGVPILDAMGEFRGYRCIDRDITERKKSETELIKSEEKYRSFVETAFSVYFEVDTNIIFTYVTPTFEDIFGYKVEEMIGRKAYEMVPKQEQPLAEKLYRELMKSEQPFTNLENLFVTKSGQVLTLESNAMPFYDSDGKLLGYRGIARDITERKNSELAIKQSEEKYRQLFECANDAIILYKVTEDNQAGEILDVNDVLCEMTGYSKKEILAVNPADLSLPYNSNAETMTPLIMEKGKLTYERLMKNKSGRLIPVEVSSHAFELEEEGVVLGIVRDITERKEAELALIESEKKYSTLLFEMTNGFTYRQLIFDEKGKVVDFIYEEINENYEQLTGRKREDIVGKKFSEIYPEAFKDSDFDWLNEFAEVAMTGKPKRFIQYFNDLNSWFDISVFSIEKGYFATAFENVTDRIEALQRIQESEERYRTLVETMNEGLAVIDTSNVFTFVNLKMHDILGYTVEELIERPITDFLTEENQELLKKQVKARRKGATEPYEMSFIRKDGTDVATIISPKQLFDDMKKYIGSFAVITDITGQKKAEELRRMAYNQIVNNIQEFANLIDGIRNPLSIMQGAVDLEIPNWNDIITIQIQKISSITEQIDLRWNESEKFRNALIEQLQ